MKRSIPPSLINNVIHSEPRCIIFSNKIQTKMALEVPIRLYLIGPIGWVKSDHSEAIWSYLPILSCYNRYHLFFKIDPKVASVPSVKAIATPPRLLHLGGEFLFLTWFLLFYGGEGGFLPCFHIKNVIHFEPRCIIFSNKVQNKSGARGLDLSLPNRLYFTR